MCYRPRPCQCRFRKRLLNRPIFSIHSRIHSRPKQFHCRPRPALLTLCPALQRPYYARVGAQWDAAGGVLAVLHRLMPHRLTAAQHAPPPARAPHPAAGGASGETTLATMTHALNDTRLQLQEAERGGMASAFAAFEEFVGASQPSTQVCVNPTQAYVNPTQVRVNPTQVRVNP